MQFSPTFRLSLAAVLVGALAVPAAAHDHRAPKARVFAGERSQLGRPYAEQWVRADGPNACVAGIGHGPPTFPEALRHQSGEEIFVRLHKVAPPLEVEAYHWRGVNRYGQPKGEPSALPSVLRPHVVAGEVRAWDAVVTPPPRGRHLYLGLEASWADEEGCGGIPDLGSQHVAWTFHLKTDPNAGDRGRPPRPPIGGARDHARHAAPRR